VWLVRDIGGYRVATDDLPVAEELARVEQELIGFVNEGFVDNPGGTLAQEIHDAIASPRKFKQIVRLLKMRREVNVDASQMDADTSILAAPNGIVDLATGALRHASSRDLCVLRTGVPYIPHARSAGFMEALSRLSPEEADEIQHALGMSLWGAARQKGYKPVYVVYGSERSRETFFTAIRAALGDYAVIVPPTRWIPKMVARRRLVLVPDVPKGVQAAPEFWRSISGRARSYTPWLGLAVPPAESGLPHNVLRRVRAFALSDFPWTYYPSEELAGILAWIVAGAREE